MCSAAATGGSIRVQGLDLAPDTQRVLQGIGPSGNAHANLRRHWGALVVSADSIQTNEVVTALTQRQTDETQPLLHDPQCEPCPLHRTRARIRHLTLANKAVVIADRNFERLGTSPPASAPNLYTVVRKLPKANSREISHHVRRHVRGGILHFVKQLLLARCHRHQATGLELCDD